MMSFVLLLLFILKVVCLAFSANGEFVSPPHISYMDLKRGFHQQEERVSLLEEKPPFRFKPGKDTLHHGHELDFSAKFNSVGEALCRSGVFPNPDDIPNKNDKFSNTQDGEGFLQQLDTGGCGYGDRYFKQRNKPHNCKLKKHQFLEDMEKTVNYSQNNILFNVQLNNFEKPNTYQETLLTRNPNYIGSAHICCLITEALTCFGDVERRPADCSSSIHSQGIPVKIKM